MRSNAGEPPFGRRVTGLDGNEHTAAAETDPGVRLTDSTRTEAFSDGVLAITITLLVVELGRPSYERGHLVTALADQWPSYLAFVVSFVYVGIIWLNHHALFARIRFMDRGLQWRNLSILMTAALLPFPTGVLAEAFAAGGRADERVAVGLYALVGVVISTAWIRVFPYLREHPQLWEHGSDAAYFTTQQARAWTGAILYAVAGVLGVVAPAIGLALFTVLVGYHAATIEGPAAAPFSRWHRRRARNDRVG